MHFAQPLPYAGVLCATLLLGGAQLWAQPSIVWTASESTSVMSGPADSYYPVLKVPRGTQLEVHQRLEGGWLAIRPPEGSYSLVSATAIESVDYRTARVKRAGVASRIGSALVDETSAVHVRLQIGELIEVLDPSADPATHLVRIAPPAGEFRWVRAEDVSDRPISVSQAVENSSQPTAPTAADAHAVTAVPVDPQPAAEATPPPAVQVPSTQSQGSGEWRERAEEPESPVSDENRIEVVRFDSTDSPTTPAPSEPQLSSEEAKPATGNAPSQSTPMASSLPQSPAPPSGDFATQLDLLEIQLSRRITGPPHLWAFEDLENESARLANLAIEPGQLARLRELSTRMARFAEIANRHRAAAQGAQLAGAPTSLAPGLPAASSATSTSQGYDAVGILRPVVSPRAGAPPYALVDEKGEVVTFVTPGPSSNLQAYLGQRVAVSGTKAYLPSYRRRNIQTARVQPMPTTRTR